MIYVRFLHLTEELARVCGQRFDIAPLALGEDGVEGQGGFAGTRQSSEDNQPVARDLDVDVFEIVLTGAADDYSIVEQRHKWSSHLTWCELRRKMRTEDRTNERIRKVYHVSGQVPMVRSVDQIAENSCPNSELT